ncbi:LLM class F420-dependent oxidoreductase [Streptomyces mirabilis]|uniref:LLM class F420-dependent oxidoreductase n=1 Tax=Streptomyces mirabilis TaxID=68239 RepID=UPI0021BFC769|nr:LLM class F420-dependent oxidoreductase [Streptomyces mirabilis]MCT9110057.1 LLM class F420-dependent oxidoreductase [Streptomyces mirabilis]
MNLGMAIADFTQPHGPAGIARHVGRLARTAEEYGFTRIAVMDHLFQIGIVGTSEQEMLEAYTTLGYLAASTERVELLALVTSAGYREPGLLAKMVTTLDVLSEGRAALGIGVGAGFNVAEARGLGLPFPPVAERFERLEETLRICLQMWSDDEGPFNGRHYRLERTLNSPRTVRRPHPPVLIGGSGERKTLRLVAEYGNACNLFHGPDLRHKLDVLRGHCDRAGRDYDTIEKTVLLPLDPGPRGEHVPGLLAELRQLHRIGIDHVIGPVRGADQQAALQLLGERVVPETAHF